MLCPTCLELMTLVPLEERCPRCFAQTEGERCERCIKCSSPFKRAVAAFEYEGPARSLVCALKYGRREEIAADLAAFMVMQFLRLSIPPPEVIVPVPQAFLRRIDRGYNQSLLIAKEVGKLLHLPVHNLLKRASGGFSQTSLSRQEREELDPHLFSWKKGCTVADKRILLVDDVMTTGATLRRCGEILQEGFPAAIYALTFCG